tara:strand:- start:552 stop:857 length:306 start_codon:yes stop_codon:yes gene_type:complete
MSGTEHFKGKLTPTGKTVEQYMDLVDTPSYYDDKTEYFNDEFRDVAIEIDGQVYSIVRNEYEDSDDIFESTKNKDGTIDFQVKYYNGGCGFGEALEYALKK